MKHQAFCHNCGADISLDQPIRIDDFSMLGESFPLCYRGRPVKLTAGERMVVWSLLKAYPDTVTKPTLLDRMDSDGVNNTIQVLICRIRRALRGAGAPDSIETVWHTGYRWRPGGGDDVAAKVMVGDESVTDILHGLFDASDS